MVLNDMQIEQQISRGNLVRPDAPFLDSQDYADYLNALKKAGHIQPASLDVTLGSSFKRPVSRSIITMDAPVEYEELSLIEGKYIFISPHSFILGTTNEFLNLPDDITAFVEGRSSIGRMGLFVQNAGWIDPGFKGEITLELYNASDVTIQLEVNRRVAQLVFVKMSNPCINPYIGKYQYQRGATESRINEDAEVK